MITAREHAFEKNQKEYIVEFNSNDMQEIKKEFNKIIKKFKNCNNYDKISLKIDIKYHKNDEFLFFKGL